MGQSAIVMEPGADIEIGTGTETGTETDNVLDVKGYLARIGCTDLVLEPSLVTLTRCLPT